MLCEIPIPDGYEFVRWGVPENGEWIMVSDREVIEARSHFSSYVIVRPVVPWPEWLDCEWVAMDADGNWGAFGSEPLIRESVDGWISGGGIYDIPQCVKLPFVVTDWRESKRKNPRGLR